MELHFKTKYRQTSGNQGIAELDGRPSLEIAPPPAFKGPEGFWSPEDLFVSAVETCYFLTLLFLLKKNQVTLVEYSSQADGLLESIDGQMRFTRLDLYPRIVVEHGDAAEIEKLLHEAEAGCLVAASIKTEIVLHPEIEIAI